MGTEIALTLCFLLIILALTRLHFYLVKEDKFEIERLSKLTLDKHKEIDTLKANIIIIKNQKDKLEKELDYCEDQRARKGKKKK